MLVVPAGDQTEIVGAWVAEMTGAKFELGMFSAFAILSDTDKFVAGVVINNYDPHSKNCQITCATETSAAWRPWVMKAVFGYIFNQLQCVRVTAATTKRNKRARGFLEGLGFELEGNLRLGYDGRRDALIYGLLARDCRYLEVEGQDGEIDTESADAA